MKFDALRSSVARLFETAATLVAPKTGAIQAKPEMPPTPSIDRIIHDALVNSGTLPPGAKVEVKQISGPLSEDAIKRWKGNEVLAIPHRLLPGREHPGIKPPPDNAYPWKMWTAQMLDEGKNAPPGWAFCRIGNRQCFENDNQDDDTVEFVFGFARGSFGIWRKPFKICEWRDGQTPTDNNRILTCITHLQSGISLGLFFDTALAAEACELIDRAAIEWAKAGDPSKPETWSMAFHRMVQIWEGIGVRASPTHAHDTNVDGELSPPMFVFERTAASMQHGRPEKLS